MTIPSSSSQTSGGEVYEGVLEMVLCKTGLSVKRKKPAQQAQQLSKLLTGMRWKARVPDTERFDVGNRYKADGKRIGSAQYLVWTPEARKKVANLDLTVERDRKTLVKILEHPDLRDVTQQQYPD